MLVALFLGTTLPVHAGMVLAHDGIGAGDFCTTSGNREAPGTPERVHAQACASCFTCGGSAALPRGDATIRQAIGDTWLAIVARTVQAAAAPHRHALARGPPRLA